MIGFDVAPVAPKTRFEAINSGSMESSHSFVPEATSDWSGDGMGEERDRRNGKRPGRSTGAYADTASWSPVGI